MKLLNKYIMVRAIVIIICMDCSYGMSRQQMKKTLKMVKNQCMSKNNVVEDQVGGIEQGKFIEERNVMCYIACVYKNIQVVKNEKLNMDAVQKQVDILYPVEMRAPVRVAIDKCSYIIDKYEDLCEMSYWAAKCLYDEDPENFIFA